MTATQDVSTGSTSGGGEIGKARRRKEDQRLITGRTRWTDNIALPGMLHMAMVRSPFAHARITNIETSEAMLARLGQPSSSVKAKENLLSDSRAQLGKWRKSLDRAQVDRILRVVRLAGLGHIYSDALEPEYDALNACQDPIYRW